MDLSVPTCRKVKGQSAEYCVQCSVSGRLTQTWLRYSELRDLSQRLKTIKGMFFGLGITVLLGMPRLSHFPSRLGDNRSERGVESRRQDLDLYLKSLSRWHIYPHFLEEFIRVKIPESMLLTIHDTGEFQTLALFQTDLQITTS